MLVVSYCSVCFYALLLFFVLHSISRFLYFEHTLHTLAGGLSGSSLSTCRVPWGRGRYCLHPTSPIPRLGGIGYVVVVVVVVVLL